MMNPWRPLAAAAVAYGTIGVGVAMAQTVIVRNAPPGATVELALNATKIGSGTADAKGDALLPVNLAANANKAETDAFIFVDSCDNLRRVMLVERGAQPPPQESGCDRRQIIGIFLVRRVSTLVVDVAGPNPTVLLRQGSVSLNPRRTWDPSPAGLMIFGGGGLGSFSHAKTVACGNVPDCDGELNKFGYNVGVAYWFTRHLAAEGSFLKPSEVSIHGSTDTFRFDSFQDTYILSMVGKVGFPAKRVRIYGLGGVNYTRGTLGTTQTTDDTTVTIDDVPVTIEGGTQTFSIETSGWGWTFGGGMEAWLAPRFGIYFEGGFMGLKGTAMDDADGELDERVNYVVAGARIRIR